MAISFNIPSAPAAFYNTTIDRENYFFRFKWQDRSQAWYLDVENKDGIILAKSAKLVPNVPILTKNLESGPDGNIYVIKTTEVTTSIPTRFGIGPEKDFELLYLTNEELGNAS